MNKTMIVSKQNHHTFRAFSINGHAVSGRSPEPSHIFMFADLRGRVFDGLNLSNIEFFGCRLDGVSFQRTCLHGARFIGCFSSSQGSPADFRGSIWKNTFATGCHLNYLFSQEVPGFDCWAVELVEACDASLSRRNDVRNRAAVRLGTVGNPVVAPYLATLLADEEWDVRLRALKALVKLRGESFSYRDQDLMKQMFLSLGDPEPIVADEALELIQTLKPDDEVLRFAVSQMSASESQEQLAGLRAATQLYQFDADYFRLLDLETLHQLLSDESPLVREECLYLLSKLDEPDTLDWVLECVSDPVASVRTEAIRTIGWLNELAETHEIEHLLVDVDEDVRLQTLYTLEESELLEPKHLALALADSSPKVLRAARHIQAELEETDEAHVDAKPDVEPHFA